MAGLGLAILLIATIQNIGTQAQTSSNFIFNPVYNMVSKPSINLYMFTTAVMHNRKCFAAQKYAYEVF
jgi:hypothetical protein